MVDCLLLLCNKAKSSALFLDALERNAAKLELPYKALDKKSEKKLLHAQKKQLQAELDEDRNAVAALHKLILILYARAFHRLLHVPGKLLKSVLLEPLREKVGEEKYARLCALHVRVSQLLARKAEEANDDNDEELFLEEIKSLAAPENIE